MPLRLLSTLLVALAALQVAALALSVVTVVITPQLAWLVLIISAMAGAYAWNRTPAVDADDDSAEDTRFAWTVSTAVTVVASLVYASLWVHAFRTPDESWDGNAYHLPAIFLWRTHGYIYWVSEQHTLASLINGYPKGGELVGFVLMRALSVDTLANVFNLAFLPVGVAGIAACARGLGASPAWSRAVAATFVLVPVNVYQSGTAYVDTAYACCVIAFAAMCVAWLRSTEPARLLPGLSAAMALTLSVKFPGVLAVAVGLTLLVLLRPAAWRLVALAFAASLVVAGYWYGRNYAHHGSPFYPIGVSLMGLEVFPGASLDAVVGLEANTPPELRDMSPAAQLFGTWTQGGGAWPGSIRGVDARLGGLGYSWLVGGLPAALVMARRFERRAFLLLALVVTLLVLTPLAWWARFTIWVHALGLPALAVVVTRFRLMPVRVWAIGVWALALYEGGDSVYRVVTAEPSDWAYALDRGRLPGGNEPVGVGPFALTSDGTSRILALLARDHAVTAVSEAVDPEWLTKNGVRTLIWDRQIPRPSGFEHWATFRAGMFEVFELGE